MGRLTHNKEQLGEHQGRLGILPIWSAYLETPAQPLGPQHFKMEYSEEIAVDILISLSIVGTACVEQEDLLPLFSWWTVWKTPAPVLSRDKPQRPCTSSIRVDTA